MKISIIIPTYNRYAKLLKLLESIAAFLPPNTDDYEVIIIDDGSTDQTAHLDGSLFGNNYRTIHTSNMGPCNARNFGAQKAKGQLLAFLDDDCLITKQYAESLYRHSCNPQFDLIGGPAYPQPSNSGIVPDYLDSIGFLQKPLYDSMNRYACFPSVNIVVKKEAFNSLGGFSSDFKRPGGEDNHFTIRAREVGLFLEYDQSLVVLHDNQMTFFQFCKKFFNYGRGNARNLSLLNLHDTNFGLNSSSLDDLIIRALKNIYWNIQTERKTAHNDRKGASIQHSLLSVVHSFLYQLGGYYERYSQKNK